MYLYINQQMYIYKYVQWHIIIHRHVSVTIKIRIAVILFEDKTVGAWR